MGIAIVCAVALVAASDNLRAQKHECLVEPYLDVSVSTAVPGILDEVNVDRGDVVSTGQVLATLLSDAEKANYELVKARAEFAARRAERNEEMFLKQMISAHEKDELETDAQLLTLEVREVEERLKQRTVWSPLDGVVVERMFSPGEFVSDDPILRLAQVDPLRVEVAVPGTLWGKIKVGMTGQVEWEAPVEGLHPAKVTVVDPVIDAASGTLGIRLELPNPRRKLPAGTKCWVTFPIE